jgi:ankyrin repeat protein
MVHTQDCFERLLVTGTGATALERKDPFSGETPLIAQVQLGEHENAKRLLQAGADPNAAKAGGERALLIAAKEGREDLVQLLVDFKAEVDARDEPKKTALHWASQLGHPAAVQALLKAGANIEAKDEVSLKFETLTRPLADLRVHRRVGCTHAFVHIFRSVLFSHI